ncbi:GntR family transcriptional regulator [Falsirhodobacter sp. alg1]|uniref:GntR family transcriptional regulator n=1 Tax=Falsirhodobacter sp. alg1 TaxID=1472418 RepID=UPI0005F034EC|nr:GntR family transcriptional regulator [Falsirhodobacter sp. alg1]
MTYPQLKKITMGAQIAAMLRAAILGGELAPGSAVVETSLALRFGVSRGPLREAMRELIDEGLLITVPYTGTKVLELSPADINDIYSMRICLEKFAFEQIWDRRDDAFREQILQRHAALLAAIDANDDVASIEAELNLHGLAYEMAQNAILMKTWNGIRGRLQLYWAAHHRAHHMQGPQRTGHDDYVSLAIGNDLDLMRAEIESHMQRGLEITKAQVQGELSTRV